MPAEGIGFVELVVEYIEKIDLLAADLAAIGTKDLGYSMVLISAVLPEFGERRCAIGWPIGAARPAGRKAAVAERGQRHVELIAGQRRIQHEFGAVLGDAIRVQYLPAHVDGGAIGVGPGYDDVAIEELCYRRSILVSSNSRVDGMLGPKLRKAHGTLLVLFVLLWSLMRLVGSPG